jgi:hypothetical protein
MRRSSVLVLSTIATGVLYIAATFALGTAPKPDDSADKVLAWFRDNGSHVRTWLWLGTLALMVLMVFAALVREHLPPVHRDLFLAGAVLLVAESAVQGWLWAGLAWHPSQVDAATARLVFDIASYWGPVLTGATVLMLGPVAVVAWRREVGLPRWLGVVAGIAFVEQLIETITITAQRGFIAPGGPMNLLLGAGLTVLALLCTGVAVSRAMAR